MPNDLRHTPDTDERIRQLIHVGAEILGGTAGSLAETAIGFLVAGPAGAAIGGAGSTAISMVLRRVGADVTERLLSPREQARVGFVLTSAAAEIHSRNEQGEPLRTDGFFDPGNGDRSDAEEVAESVLLRSQREPEEKKLPYMAHLLANIAFDTKVNAYLAHQISKIAEQLTYRQFCILWLATIEDSFELRMVNYIEIRIGSQKNCIKYYMNSKSFIPKSIFTSLKATDLQVLQTLFPEESHFRDLATTFIR